jgi:hypothetical protein
VICCLLSSAKAISYLFRILTWPPVSRQNVQLQYRNIETISELKFQRATDN